MQTLHNVTQQSIGCICRQGLMHISMQTPYDQLIWLPVAADMLSRLCDVFATNTSLHFKEDVHVPAIKEEIDI